jgi:hypothetical protein
MNAQRFTEYPEELKFCAKICSWGHLGNTQEPHGEMHVSVSHANINFYGVRFDVLDEAMAVKHVIGSLEEGH